MAVQPTKAIVEDISYLKQDMAKVGLLVDRLDVTIDKLTEVSTNISQLLAVHETKITSQELLLKQQTDLMEKRRQEVKKNCKRRLTSSMMTFFKKSKTCAPSRPRSITL
jgi:hypothetical protein